MKPGPLSRRPVAKKSRKRKRSARAEKAKKDQETRALVMERDRYKCQLAGLGKAWNESLGWLPLRCTPQLQWMHIKSRRYLSTRWLPANSLAGCAAHHRWSHDNPDEFIEWWLRTYPERAAEVKAALKAAALVQAMEAMLK